MKEISIKSPKHGNHVALVDDDDYDKLVDLKWRIFVYQGKGDHTIKYATTSVYKEDGRRTSLFMHRIIMQATPGTMIDHINHNGLDNRKENLRFATPQQNQFNRYAKPGSSSKYKGVIYAKANNNWRAKIVLNERAIHLGQFENEEDAAKQYDYFAIKYFGEFAVLNFPDFDYSNYKPYNYRDTCSSKYHGVSWLDHRKKWQARVKVEKEEKYIGIYSTQEEAAIARNKYIKDNNLNAKINDIEE